MNHCQLSDNRQIRQIRDDYAQNAASFILRLARPRCEIARPPFGSTRSRWLIRAGEILPFVRSLPATHPQIIHKLSGRPRRVSAMLWTGCQLIEFLQRSNHAHDRLGGVLGVVDTVERLHPIHTGTGHAEAHRLVEFERQIDRRTRRRGRD